MSAHAGQPSQDSTFNATSRGKSKGPGLAPRQRFYSASHASNFKFVQSGDTCYDPQRVAIRNDPYRNRNLHSLDTSYNIQDKTTRSGHSSNSQGHSPSTQRVNTRWDTSTLIGNINMLNTDCRFSLRHLSTLKESKRKVMSVNIKVLNSLHFEDTNENERDTIIAALKWLIEYATQNPQKCRELDFVWRNTDLIEGQRPYCFLTTLFALNTHVKVLRLLLRIFNILLSSISSERQVQFWMRIEDLPHSPLKELINTAKTVSELNEIRVFQWFYLKYLQLSFDTNPNLNNPLHRHWIDSLFKCCEPISSMNHYVIWKSCSVITLKCVLYMAQTRGKTFRQLLDENEHDNEWSYFLPFVFNQIVARLIKILLCDVSSDTLATEVSKPSKGGGDDASLMNLFLSENTIPSIWGNPFIPVASLEIPSSRRSPPDIERKSRFHRGLLFTSKDAMAELFVTSSVFFDRIWKSLPARRDLAGALDTFERYMELTIKKSIDINHAKRNLLLNELVISAKIDLLFNASDVPLFPELTTAELSDFFSELLSTLYLRDVNENMNVLSDVIRALSAIGSNKKFDWNVMSSEHIFLLLCRITHLDSTWVQNRHVMLHTILLLEKQLDCDVHGSKKFYDALIRLAIENGDSPSLVCKPLVKLLRNNVYVNAPLRIINKLFENKSTVQERLEYLNYLANAQALSIMKSKMWSTSQDSRKELLKFQENMLTYDLQTFDPDNDHHTAILADIWESLFSNVPIRLIRGPQIWLLGFRSAKTSRDFAGKYLLSFENLSYFVRNNPIICRAIFFNNTRSTFSLGDYGFSITDVLLNIFTTGGVLMPMLFDDRERCFFEIYSIVFLWVIQQWIINKVNTISLVAIKVEAHVSSVIKKNKPACKGDFFERMKIDIEKITAFSREYAHDIEFAQGSSTLAFPSKTDSFVLNGGKYDPNSRQGVKNNKIKTQIESHSAKKMGYGGKFVNQYVESNYPDVACDGGYDNEEEDTRVPLLNNDSISRLRESLHWRQNTFLLSMPVVLPQDEKVVKELLKQRKIEMKKQKEYIKQVLNKQKFLQKKQLEDLNHV